jgi:hypothetical protein
MAIADATRRVVRQRANERCEYCHADERWQFVRFTLDHIQPRSVGGTDESINLALACRNCNERRGNRCEAIDPETKSVVALFNPRSQSWGEHFAWSADKTRIVGMSPAGRAAVQLLDMNDDRHDGNIVRVRLRDLEDGFHPPADDPVLSNQV